MATADVVITLMTSDGLTQTCIEVCNGAISDVAIKIENATAIAIILFFMVRSPLLEGLSASFNF